MMFHSALSEVPFKSVQTESDMQDFLKECMSFHDGVLKELHVLNTGCVDDDFSMSYYFNFNMRMLVQTQWKSAPAVEILFGDLTEMRIANDRSTMDCIYGSNGGVQVNPVSGESLITLELGENRFVCGALAYRIRQDCMGIESRFGEEIVLDASQGVERIDEEWVICRICNETWKHNGREVVVCPKCRMKSENLQ